MRKIERMAYEQGNICVAQSIGGDQVTLIESEATVAVLSMTEARALWACLGELLHALDHAEEGSHAGA